MAVEDHMVHLAAANIARGERVKILPVLITGFLASGGCHFADFVPNRNLVPSFATSGRLGPLYDCRSFLGCAASQSNHHQHDECAEEGGDAGTAVT